MSREDQANKRSGSVRIRLAPEMQGRLEKVAGDFGMSPSTLAAFAVASFVRQQEQTIFSTSRMSVLESLVVDGK